MKLKFYLFMDHFARPENGLLEYFMHNSLLLNKGFRHEKKTLQV